LAEVAGALVPIYSIEKQLRQISRQVPSTLVLTAIPDAELGERIIAVYTDVELNVAALIARYKEAGTGNWAPESSDFVHVKSMPMLPDRSPNLPAVKQIAMLR
jgi:hypothetical protein